MLKSRGCYQSQKVFSPGKIHYDNKTRLDEFCPKITFSWALFLHHYCKWNKINSLMRDQPKLSLFDDYPTFRYMQWFQRGTSRAVQQCWPEVNVAVWCFFGCRRQPGCGADWGQAESILWLSICSSCVLPGAGLWAADTHSAPGAIWELWWRSAEVQERLVLDLSRRGCFGGAVLLRGMGGQRLHAAHGGAAWTATESVTYAGTREEAYKALIKTCWVRKWLWLPYGLKKMNFSEDIILIWKPKWKTNVFPF